MRWRWSLVVVGFVCLAVAGCAGCAGGGDATRGAGSTPPPSAPVASDAWGPASFRYIPADTPYLFASVNAPSAAPSAGPGTGPSTGPSTGSTGTPHELWTLALSGFKASLTEGDSGQKPSTRAILALLDEIQADKTHSWKAHLGLPENLHYVVYGLSVWPVLRVDVADPGRLTALLARTWSAAHQEAHPVRDGKATYWLFPERKATTIVIVTDRELVASVLPGSLAEQALPYLLGTKLPPSSLALAPRAPAMVRLLRTTRDNLGYVDLQQIASILLGRATGLNATLRGDASVERDAELTPACVADIDRLVAVAPRVLWGIPRFDEHGVTGRVVVEVPRELRGPLRALRTSFGGLNLPAVHQAVFAMGGAVDIDGLVRWIHGRLSAARAAPFQCAQLAPLNDALATLDDALGVSWPEVLRGLRGGVVALNDVSAQPLRCDGFALLDGGNLGKLAPLASALPGRPFGTLAADGKPVALPLAAAGIPLQTTGHIALTDTRAVIALGPDSDVKSEQLLHTSADPAPPLLFVRFDLPRFRELMAAMNKPMEPLPFEYQTMGAALQIDEDGLRFDVNMTW